MITSILVLLIRRYCKNNPHRLCILSKIFSACRIVSFLFLPVLIPIQSKGQVTVDSYVVKKNGSKVGTLNIRQVKTGIRTSLFMESQVTTRFIFLLTSTLKEEAIYENGILIQSAIYRELNGNEKANKKIRMSGDVYIITSNGQDVIYNKPIKANILWLYMREPVDVSNVYSDNFQTHIPIRQTGSHRYTLSFPDGNSQEFIYRNGICIQVNIIHSFYTAQLVRKI